MFLGSVVIVYQLVNDLHLHVMSRSIDFVLAWPIEVDLLCFVF